MSPQAITTLWICGIFMYLVGIGCTYGAFNDIGSDFLQKHPRKTTVCMLLWPLMIVYWSIRITAYGLIFILRALLYNEVKELPSKEK